MTGILRLVGPESDGWLTAWNWLAPASPAIPLLSTKWPLPRGLPGQSGFPGHLPLGVFERWSAKQSREEVASRPSSQTQASLPLGMREVAPRWNCRAFACPLNPARCPRRLSRCFVSGDSPKQIREGGIEFETQQKERAENKRL